MISVIIPVYNQQKELLLALESIKEQTYRNVEVIIIDDGSETPPYPPLVGEGKGGVTVIHQKNQGAPVARNKGFEMSRGEYVIFWDADVVAEPEMLEKMHQALQKNLQASYAYSNFQFPISPPAISMLRHWRAGNFQSIFNFQKKVKSREFDTEALKQNNFIHSTSLIRRKDVIKWDESLKRFQDWDLWLTMAEQGKKGVWIDEYLFKIISRGTMSRWLPSFAYKKPWKWLPGIRKKVRSYEEARAVVETKHQVAVD